MQVFALLFLLCEILFVNSMSIWQSCIDSSSLSISQHDGPSRTYPAKKFPCIKGSPRLRKEGIIYKILPWTDEDIVASAVMKMSKMHLDKNNRCQAHLDKRENAHEYAQQHGGHTFLFTFLREPTGRAIEEFFAQDVSRDKVDPTDQNFRLMLETPSRKHQDMYIRSLNFKEHTHERENKHQVVNQILFGYDFIGITERMDESLVVMKILLGLETSDILYLPDPGPFKPWYINATSISCSFRGITPFVSKNMTKFIQSESWQKKVRADTLLFQAANRSLDLTIYALGKDRVHDELREFYKAIEAAQKNCSTMFPCTASGVFLPQNDCLQQDLGCGLNCLDLLVHPLV